MGNKRHLIFVICVAGFLQTTNGQCLIDGGLSLGPVPNHEFIQDVFRGTIRNETTTNIERIASISYGGALVGSQAYLDITLVDSLFVLQTSSAFAQYEENETAESISVTITFSCTGGNTTPLILVINIQDTNNNYPQFIPTNEFEFVLAPPLPPGFLITGCLNEILVRDIDLTTRSILFEIEENPYFVIEYDEAASAAAGAKHFNALLKTLTFIRTLREPITLRITATDVDATGDPPLSTYGTIRISGDTEFELPEEPVFSQTFYFATYTDEHQLIQHDTISLQQGFDEYVQFTLDGDYMEYFNASADGNQVTLVVNTPLPIDVLVEKQIFLIVRAERNYTSGDTATIVIHLPEVTPLMFDSALYKGYIVDNVLQLSPLVLSQGYDSATVSARIDGDLLSFFTAIVQGNVVTLIMDPLTDYIIGNNSFISIPVVASTDRSEATTIVSLEIIKDDNVTPVFDEFIYTGSYDPINGLTVDQIEFVQGFDGTVTVELDGDHKGFFLANLNGSTVHLTSSVIPPELFEEQQITLSIKAIKQRTVGANAVIIITLPSARVLDFEEPTYRGTIQDNDLLLQTILLSDGYDENVRFTHSGDYSTYFNVTNIQNQVTLTLLFPLPDTVITQNNVIALTITASGLNAISASTNVLLDIIKEDTTTPVLSQKIYYGTYRGSTDFEIENIFLTQGYDSEVSFKLDDSAHAQYFEISNTGNSATLRLRSAIPQDVIFNEKVLLFSILAEKALTVGSHAAVLIRFPADLTESTIMRFSENYYVGAFEQNEITLSENIVLDTGYDIGTDFEIYGDYVEHFEITSINNVVHLSSNRTNTLPPEVIENNDFVILTVEARRDRAVSVRATVIIDIVKEVEVDPVFNQAYYRGSYTEDEELQFEEHINISQGYDETVRFDLDGEQAAWFAVVYEGNSATIVLQSEIPKAVLEDNNQLLFTIVALKTNGVSGRAVISIDLPNDNISFSADSYKGYLEDGIPVLEVISIQNFTIPSDANVTLSGDYSEYFQVINREGALTLELRTAILDEILEANNVLILTLAIQNRNNRISTVIVLEIVNTDTERSLTFEKPYYVGSYKELSGLDFRDEIKLTEARFDTVSFNLEGNDSQWFDLVRGENSVELILKESIPTNVLLNNHQFIFEVLAERAVSRTARATIVISLPDRFPETVVLGFDQIHYIGSIENNQSTHGPITLNEGYVQGVQFTLHGELKDYFDISSQGAVVTVTLPIPIPEHSIPANRIIVLEIQASAPQTMAAYATLVMEYIVDDNVSPIVELIFAQTYYTGSYTDTAGLTFMTPISLTDGYDANVQFSLGGDYSQWFTLVGTANSQTLSLSSPIPAAVLANNKQLIFVVEAQRPGSTTTRATIVIFLSAEYTEGLVLGFDQITYRGSIENNQVTIAPITLSEGYVQGVQFTLHGELKDYFDISAQGAAVNVTLPIPVPEQSIPANRIIVLEIQASAPQAMPAYATLVMEYLVGDEVSPVLELIFAQTYYTGSYTDTAGLTFTTPISLTDGYNADVQFSLDGDDSQWFSLVGTANSQTLSLSSPIPAAVLANNQQLIFVVEAQRPGSTTTRATIVIFLSAEYTEGLVLGFDQITYRGSIENNQVTIAPITLSEGYVQGVQFTLHGELKDYFDISAQGAAVNVTLPIPIPEQSIPANRIIVLEIQASAPQAMPAYATLVMEYLVDDEVSPVLELIFAQTYYTGSYTDTAGLTFTTPISLTDGYNADVQFSLDGDDSQWFTLVGTANSQTLSLSSPIPAAVLANNQQLIFVVEAQRPGSTTTRATIVIFLSAEYTEGLVLGFDQITYRGSIENNQVTIAPITLSEGYVQGVQFTLHGELKDYFDISAQGAAVNVTLPIPIPEQSIPANRIIVLEIQASAPQAMPAYATLVMEYLVDDEVSPVLELIFAQTYYTGSYTDTAGLTFTTPISLTDGYNADVQFSLDGDDSQWFTLVGTANSQTLSLSSPIPAAVLANNQQLIFVVEAQRPGSTTTRATIVIFLSAEYTEGLVLGFDQITYRGSIENNQVTIAPITLSEGYVQGVQFTLHGELKDYFDISAQGAAVNVTLPIPIPEQSIPANRIIVLEIQASAPQAMPAYATLVMEYLVDDEVSPVLELIFAQTYYTGSYTDTAGLTFTTPISLTDGYNADVQFSLDGDDSQWFTLVGTANSQTLSLSSPIPAAVLANNQQLIFVVEAQRPGSTTTRATIVIFLSAEYTEGLVLGFDQITYRGSIENNQVTIAPITLSEGYVQGVQFTLHGELKDYFDISAQGAAVNVTLPIPIPEQSIPANRIIVLEIQASAPQAMPAYATLVMEYLVDDEVSPVLELIFAQTYYTGSYTDTAGLTFTTPISLTDGYNADVQFSLDGDDSQWFTLVGTANSQTLSLSSPIPAAVLANNQQLIFVVEAQRPGSTTTRATIVIFLSAEYTEGLVLGFDQITYRGSIENNQVTIAPITLSEGYVQGVQFTLHGELKDYFDISAQGAAVNVTLPIPIPEQSIPANRIIVLEIQASAPQAMPAYATLVMEYLVDDEVSPVLELIFAQTYYTGSYTDTAGLTFTTPISLTDGYNADVQFSLDGDDSQWFTLVGTANSQTLSLSSPIPAAVLANNQQLIFVVEAQRPGSTTTRATIVIFLSAEYTEGLVLGFDQITYRGSIENNQVTIAPITLSEGYVQGVQFTLHGELKDYFDISAQGAAVNVTLPIPIPEQSIPANRIIVLEIQASAPQAMPAYATLVMEYLVDDEVSPVLELIFAQTYYTGSYTDTAGLTFTTPISLTDGYNADVQFSLDGDDSQWFTLVGTANSQTLSLSSPIPAAVLANNQQLIFVVEAQRPGSTTTRATIVIFLSAEYTEGLVLGFDQITYRGSIENNQVTIAPITLSEGYVQGVQFTLHGELKDYFDISAQGAAVNVTLPIPIPEQSIPANRIIVLEIQASAPQAMPAYATLVIEYLLDDEVSPVVELIFAQTYYTGSYTDTAGLTFTTPISLTDGYNADVQFSLDGDYSQWFTLVGTANSQTLSLSSPIPAVVLANNQQLIFVVEAQRPGSPTTRATIIIFLTADSLSGSDVVFEKVLFEGVIRNGVVSHETITVTGFNGTRVELDGVYSSLFEADLYNGEVTVKLTGSLALPAGTAFLTLVLRAGTAGSVLVLDVSQSDVPTPTPPVVTFSSATYAIRVEITDTGVVGQVQASADNGEAVRYSLQETNVHLGERLSINDVGELHLSAPVNSGLYTFQVVATTIFTQEIGNATVYLSAEAITVCAGEIVMPPLIVLDRDEEEPHFNLVNTYQGCHFELSNRWPSDQDWLYVDETGLHTRAIDREHESIAFMTLSQVQVDITLHCDTDETRVKRSLVSKSPDHYDYGTSKWILTDTILFNSRRSLVNLIVNDINDNAPVFEGKNQEPIAVGYPVPELEDIVLPRSLAELKATDADIGENAALLYWSSEPVLAVSPSTGFVHIRYGAQLENDARLTVNATDRNGQGLTGSIDILVRLLDASNILVVTVRDAFLDSETNVLSRLSESVGYEIKVLRSVVISDDETNEEAMKKREVTSATGALLQLYVYGLIEREPVSIERLITDISSAGVAQLNIASTVSLEDHLAGQEICVIPGRDTGLLAATIVLSVLLFIIIVLIGVWYFLRWRREQQYDQFSDTNSLASRNEPGPKPVDVGLKPRLNIEELKKSERRLQEMLDAPVQEVTVEPASSRHDAILDLSPLPDPNTPIVIQSTQKLKDANDELSDDEYGERKIPKRKSVVTFNENVEKFIHVEDTDVAEENPEYEIYKL